MDNEREIDFVAFCQKMVAGFIGCESDGGSGENLAFPEFDLLPRDYLRFAEKEIEDESDGSRINCVAHLKRAAECAVDTFLQILNLKSKSKKFSFPQKLSFVERVVLLPSRSVQKLNKIRNRVEHEYSIPDVEDLSLFFDLVSAFVLSVESAIFMFANFSETSWSKPDSRNSFLSYGYDSKTTRVYGNFFEAKEVFYVPADNWETFVHALRVHLLIVQATSLFSAEFVVDELKNVLSTMAGGKA